MDKPAKKKTYVLMLALVISLLVLDQASKRLAVELFPVTEDAELLDARGPLLDLGLAYNPGMPLALGDVVGNMDQGPWEWFFPLWVLTMIGMMWVSLLPKLPVALLTAGALGNVLEKFATGTVVDFIIIRLPDRTIIGNLADLMIVGCFAILVALLAMGRLRARNFGIYWFEEKGPAGG